MSVICPYCYESYESYGDWEIAYYENHPRIERLDNLIPIFNTPAKGYHEESVGTESARDRDEVSR